MNTLKNKIRPSSPGLRARSNRRSF